MKRPTSSKSYPEEARRVAPLFKAIRERRVHLETSGGRRKVTGYDPVTGWATTNNLGHCGDDRSVRVAESDFIIQPGI